MSDGGGRFPRRYRLKRRLLLAPLFRRDIARTLSGGSIRLLYRLVPAADLSDRVPVQVAFVAGRRKNAVVRNRIRRTLREVYRLHQQGLVDLFSRRSDALTLAVVYRGADEGVFRAVERDLPRLLERLADTLRMEVSRNTPSDGA